MQHDTALKPSLKCQFTICKLRFFAGVCLVSHAPDALQYPD